MTPNDNQRFNREYLQRRGEVNPVVGFFDGLDRALTGRFQRELPPPKGALPYGNLPASAADTPGFVANMPVDPKTWAAASEGQLKAPVRSDDVDARASEMERMRQQYGGGASFWNTDEGKDLLLDTMSNQYTGDKAGLPEFYVNQQKAGIGQIDQIIEAMGYEGPMAEWAKANPALALREYNKRQPNAYAGTGPSNEEIKAAMDAGNFFASQGSPNPLGKTGEARESNTAQTEAIQNTKRQAINNDSLNAMEALMGRSHNVAGMEGMNTLVKYAHMLHGGK